jgi:UDP-N-acetylglucosamine:LPS N-acetylglucosamine transferase
LQHVVCGSERAVEQARALGYREPWLHRVSGMIIRPDFYRPLDLDREAERRRLGLPADRPVGIVMFGGAGSNAMRTIAERLPDVPLILMCGHNAALGEQLRRAPAKAPRVVLGFTGEVRRYMALGDFFIGKPGPGALSEAIHQRLPVVTVRNAWTLPQERYNADWVLEHGLGVVLGRWRDVEGAVRTLLEDLAAYRARTAGIVNRAAFEVPDVLARILAVRGGALVAQARGGEAVAKPSKGWSAATP